MLVIPFTIHIWLKLTIVSDFGKIGKEKMYEDNEAGYTTVSMETDLTRPGVSFLNDPYKMN